MIKIESNIPIPLTRKMALKTMKKGDSFLVDSHVTRQNILRTAQQIRVKVISRKVNGCGYRIWRIK